MTAMRSPIDIASTWSCVTHTVVRWSRRWIRQIAERVSARSWVSRFDIGSSIKSSRGSRTSARPSADRCCCPPDSWLGRRSSTSASCRRSATSRTRRFTDATRSWASRSGKPMFSATVMCGYRAYVWNAIAMSRWPASTSLMTTPSIDTSPRETSSSPAIIRSTVVLPHPDGPTRTNSSPSSTWRSRSATTHPLP